MGTGFRTLAAFCSLAIMMNTGCTNPAQTSGSENSVTPLLDESHSIRPILPETTEGDSTTAEKSTCTVLFSGSGAEIKGVGAAISGGTLTINSAGVYEIKGECADGKIVIDAGDDDEVTLLLSGIRLTSSEGSAVFCKNAKKLIITAAEGSENSLSDSENYTFEEGKDEPDAAVFAKCDMVLNGSGVLNVNGRYKAGIRSKDGLKICGGDITVSSVDDGVKGKDYIIISDGKIKLDCGGDALKSTNANDDTLGYINIRGGEISITSAQDAIRAETELIIDGGKVTAVTGGGSVAVEYENEENDWGEKFSFGGSISDSDISTSADSGSDVSAKGLIAGSAITINGGEFDIDSADDAVHSNGKLTISDGSFRLSSGDDGFHAEENITINGGTINIITSFEGFEGKNIDINGGTIDLYSFDDGFNATGGETDSSYGFGSGNSDCYISISGGNITVNADGDGLDSNGSMAMSGGMVVVFGSTSNNNGALDYDSSFAVSGGTLIALGSVGMSQTPSTLSQPCICVCADVAAGSTIEVRDADDNVVLSVETPKACRSLVFTSDKFVSGEEYTVWAAGTALETVTASDGVTGSGADNPGGFGGNHGGIPPKFDRDNRSEIELPEGGMTPPEGFDPVNRPEDFESAQFAGERPNDFSGRGNREQISDEAKPNPESASESTIA